MQKQERLAAAGPRDMQICAIRMNGEVLHRGSLCYPSAGRAAVIWERTPRRI
jgi:hypothetical protein